jgi:ribosomal protein L20
MVYRARGYFGAKSKSYDVTMKKQENSILY